MAKINSENKSKKIPFRILISGIIILIELYFLAVWILDFTTNRLWIYYLTEIISIVTIVRIITERGNKSYKIMWIIFIMAIPAFGTLAYIMWGGGRMFPHLKKRIAVCSEKYFSELPDCDASESLKHNDMIHYRQAAYLKNDSGFQIYRNTQSEFLNSGENFFQSVLEELQKAEKYIYIEFFILAEGYMWDEIFKILEKKRKDNIEIKIIFDDFGSIGRHNKNFMNKLKNAGIEVSVFNPIKPSVNIFMNNRNHRKIIVIDGKTAFTGGINIGDEYINKLERFGHWQDCGIKITGEAVNEFLAMFCSMWEFTDKTAIDLPAHLSVSTADSDGFYIPYCDDPLNNTNPAQDIYMQIINTAQKYVYITTPYLILDSEMTASLCLAAKSGVDVRIITPHIPDKWYVHPVTQYYYSELLDSNVKIYEYTPGFIHSKLFVSDNCVATVGTVNMDYRSFNFHFECGVWCSGGKCVNDIKEDFFSVLEKSEEITKEAWEKRPVLTKIKQTILHLFAPLM